MSTELLTFIHFSPPALCFTSLFHCSFFLSHSVFFFAFVCSFRSFVLAAFTRRIQSRTAMCHAYFTRYFLPFRGNIYTLKMCIAKMWKLNPLNKFSRPYCSAACTEHTLNSSSSAVCFGWPSALFSYQHKRYRLILIDFVWIHFNETTIYALHELCIYRQHFDGFIFFPFAFHVPLHRFALALLIFIWRFFRVCVCIAIAASEWNSSIVDESRGALQNNLKLELCEINNKRNEFFPFIDQY